MCSDQITARGQALTVYAPPTSEREQMQAVATELAVTSAHLARRQADLARNKRSVFRWFCRQRIASIEAAIATLAAAEQTLKDWQLVTHVDMECTATCVDGASRNFVDWQLEKFAVPDKSEWVVNRELVTIETGLSKLVRSRDPATLFGGALGGNTVLSPGLSLIETENEDGAAVADELGSHGR